MSGKSEYTVRKVGQPNTLEFRAYVEKDGVPVSPFHDIPLYANEQKTILNMIVEIPRWTNAKLEVCLLFFRVSMPRISTLMLDLSCLMTRADETMAL